MKLNLTCFNQINVSTYEYMYMHAVTEQIKTCLQLYHLAVFSAFNVNIYSSTRI